ncbi:hypothetical protein [Cellulosimicrobium funkei]
MRQTVVRVVLVCGVAMTGACSVGQGPEETSDDRITSYAVFSAAFDEGADCGELFQIRNRMDPKDPAVDDANADLRSVECYSSTSSRND